MDKCKRCEYYLKDDLYFYCRAKKDLYSDSLLLSDCPKTMKLETIVSIISLAIQDKTNYEVIVNKLSTCDGYCIKCKVQPLPFFYKCGTVQLSITNFNKDITICGYKTIVKEFIQSIKDYEKKLRDEIYAELDEAIEDNKVDNGKR